ncbi:MAG: nucleotidyltransferase domain-containing protein [Planctomycetota bacterium]
MSEGAGVPRREPAPVVRRILARLIEGCAPRKVVLYGSFARGAEGPDSDIDMLIVRETAEPFLARQDEARRLASGTHPGIPFEPIVLTPAEVESRLRTGDVLLRKILREGVVLHDA